ncbi:MAG: 7-cyano-7-deazaguanine synthase QueC [Blastocatellia bacterium]
MPKESDPEFSIVLTSGGMDSCVTTAIAVRDSRRVALVHVSYGQRTALRERSAFEAIADHYGIEQRLATDIAYLTQIGGSSLTDATLEIAEANLDATEIPTTYVPFRNAHLLAIASSWAEVIGAGRLYIGAVAEDSSGYPDCRPVFYEAFSRLIEVGTRPETRVEIVTPVIALRKAEIVQLGIALQAPLHLTWSCYRAEEVACGRCDSCALRLRGFREAGIDDPLPYAIEFSDNEA